LAEVTTKAAMKKGAPMHVRKIRAVPAARRRPLMMSLLHGVAQPHRDGAFSADAIAGAVAQAHHRERKTLLFFFSSLLAVKKFSHLAQE
jgi:hypothetical protein